MTPLTAQQVKDIKQAAIGAIKGLISSIPLVGGPIIGAWDGFGSSRLDDTIKQLSTRIEKLGEEKIDMTFVKSEEFIDLLHKGLRIRLQHRSKQKAKFIYGMLIESISQDRDLRFSTALKESFLSILDQLSDEEMIFLHDFSHGKYTGKSQDDIYQIGDKEGIAMDGLLAKRILRIDSTWEQNIAESMIGREFITYLKLLAYEDASIFQQHFPNRKS